MKTTRFTCSVRPLVAALMLGYAAASSGQALPHGAAVANGTANISAFSNGLQIVTTAGTIINWTGFSIGAGQKVQFDQQLSTSAVLNRVTGNAHSEILGTLQSNGRVFLLNPNGILFGASSRVDVAGLLASTLDISDEDFLAGNYRFRCFNAIACDAGVDIGRPYNNRILLQDGSQITTRNAGEGGQVWLIAKDRITAERGSKIEAPTGQVMAATAREVTITSPAFGQMSFTLTGTTGSRIDMAGDIDIPRGAAGFFADNIRLAGIVSARSDPGAAGQIVARATSELLVDGDGRLDVSGNAGADAGAVRLFATQKIVIHPNSATAADGGAPTADHAAPMGGLIELDAYQVSLPWIASGQNLYNDRPGPAAALHAYATGAAFDDRSRHGTVRITETGSFGMDKTVLDLPISISAGTPAMLAHVDGRVLAISNDSDGLWAYVSLPNGQLAGPRRSVLPAVAAGQSISLPEERLFTLSGGGWLYAVVYQVYGEPPSPGESAPLVGGPRGMLSVIGANGQLLQSIVLDEVLPGFVQGVWATRGGGFAAPDGVIAGGLRYYTGTGAIDTLATAATAGTRPAPLQIVPTGEAEALLYDRYLSFDPRRTLAAGPPQVLTNSFTGDVLWTSTGATQLRGGMAPGVLLTDAMFDNGYTLGGRTDVYSATGELIYEGIARRGYDPAGPASYYDSLNVLGSDRVMVSHVRTVHGATMGDDVNIHSFAFYDRRPTATPFAESNSTGGVFTPLVLASAPGISNGVAGGGLPSTIPPVGSDSGGSSAAPPASGGPLPNELPSAYTRNTLLPTSLEIAPGALSVPASRITGDPPGETEAEFLEYARKFVEGLLGKEQADKLAAAKTPEERAPIMNEAAYAMAVGEDIYDVTRDMDAPMRGALFHGMAGVQLFGLETDDKFSEGLRRALTEKKPGTPNADGSPGVARTALEVPLLVLQTELAQAKTDAEKERIGRRVFYELVVAGREEAGEKHEPGALVELPNGQGGTVRISEDGDVVDDDAS